MALHHAGAGLGAIRFHKGVVAAPPPPPTPPPARLFEVDNVAPYFRIYDSAGTLQSAPATMPSAVTKAVAISPDGQYFALATASAVLLYSFGASAIAYLGAIVSPPAWAAISDVAFSPDSSKLSVCDNSLAPYVWIFDVATRTALTAPAPGQATNLARWKADGSQIVLGMVAAPYVKVFNTSNMAAAGTQPTTLPTGEIRALDYAPDGSLLAAVMASGEVTIYNAATWVVKFGPAPVGVGGIFAHPREAVFSPDSKRLAICGSVSPFLATFTISAGTPSQDAAPPNPGDSASACYFSANSAALYLATNSNVIQKYTISGNTYAMSTWKSGMPGNAFSLSGTL